MEEKKKISQTNRLLCITISATEALVNYKQNITPIEIFMKYTR